MGVRVQWRVMRKSSVKSKKKSELVQNLVVPFSFSQIFSRKFSSPHFLQRSKQPSSLRVTSLGIPRLSEPSVIVKAETRRNLEQEARAGSKTEKGDWRMQIMRINHEFTSERENLYQEKLNVHSQPKILWLLFLITYLLIYFSLMKYPFSVITNSLII